MTAVLSTPKLLREAKTLHAKALASLKKAIMAFNTFEEEGRVCTVLLHLQHACEMLLKAVLVQHRAAVFDKKTGKAIGFEKCLNLCQSHHSLTVEQAGVMRTIDALRDAEQHWYTIVSEELLYLHTRAVITSFDEYMKAKLGTDLHSALPSRVLPISTLVTTDLDLLIDREYQLVGELLQPGKRQRDEARGRIRALLAMESLIKEDADVNERDIDRIEKAVKAGQTIDKVFPRLLSIGMQSEGEGLTVKVHFSKKEGAPVRFVDSDESEEAAAVREIDLQKKFHISPTDLAKKLGLTVLSSKALRQELGIDQDKNCIHNFTFGKSGFPRYSDNAQRKMKEAIDAGVDIAEIVRRYKTGG